MVAIERRDGVAIVRMENPPVNTLTLELRTKPEKALEHLTSDHSVRGIVPSGAGGGFSAGADIREFDRPAAPPALAASSTGDRGNATEELPPADK